MAPSPYRSPQVTQTLLPYSSETGHSRPLDQEGAKAAGNTLCWGQGTKLFWGGEEGGAGKAELGSNGDGRPRGDGGAQRIQQDGDLGR